MAQKQTPKSCSCNSCKRAKGLPHGHHYLNCVERGHRQETKQSLDRFRNQRPGDDVEEADMSIAPRGDRIG